MGISFLLDFGFAVLPFFFEVVDDAGFCIKIIINKSKTEENDYDGKNDDEDGQADQKGIHEK